MSRAQTENAGLIEACKEYFKEFEKIMCDYDGSYIAIKVVEGQFPKINPGDGYSIKNCYIRKAFIQKNPTNKDGADLYHDPAFLISFSGNKPIFSETTSASHVKELFMKYYPLDEVSKYCEPIIPRGLAQDVSREKIKTISNCVKTDDMIELIQISIMESIGEIGGLSSIEVKAALVKSIKNACHNAVHDSGNWHRICNSSAVSRSEHINRVIERLKKELDHITRT